MPTERPPLLGEVSVSFADGVCRVVRVTNPYCRILGFLNRNRYFFFLLSSSSVVLTRLCGPRSRPTTGRNTW
jgi:hypothetical protein